MPEPLETTPTRSATRIFGQPYIDVDEQRDAPYPHRHVHGGFADCDTRFTFYFPDQSEWQGRMYMPLEGAHAGNEEAFGGPMGELIGGLALTARLGGYMAETNMGHIGDDIDAKAGDDPTLYGWRAAAETGRFSKHVAAQVYGSEPHHSYVWGGSGGGRRSPLVLENAPDVFDGALPFMGGGDVRPFPATERIKGAQVMSFACMFNVQRLLRSPAKAMRRDRRHAAGRQRRPVRRAEQPRARRARLAVQAGVPVRGRVHDLHPDGADLAVDVDRRPARGAGPGLLRGLLDVAGICRARPPRRRCCPTSSTRPSPSTG